jgi:hypothetical protein
MTKKEKKEERIKPEAEPERIENKKDESAKKETKHSWFAFEAPDKNGQKITHYQGKAKVMREKLMEQSEIVTFIPHEPGEAKSVPQIVNLNGYKLNIPKNTYVSLPHQIAEVIRKAHAQVEAAYAEMDARFGLDRDEKSIDALS